MGFQLDLSVEKTADAGGRALFNGVHRIAMLPAVGAIVERLPFGTVVTAECALVPGKGVTAEELLGPESVLNRAAKGVSTKTAAKVPAAALAKAKALLAAKDEARALPLLEQALSADVTDANEAYALLSKKGRASLVDAYARWTSNQPTIEWQHLRWLPLDRWSRAQTAAAAQAAIDASTGDYGVHGMFAVPCATLAEMLREHGETKLAKRLIATAAAEKKEQLEDARAVERWSSPALGSGKGKALTAEEFTARWPRSALTRAREVPRDLGKKVAAELLTIGLPKRAGRDAELEEAAVECLVDKVVSRFDAGFDDETKEIYAGWEESADGHEFEIGLSARTARAIVISKTGSVAVLDHNEGCVPQVIASSLAGFRSLLTWLEELTSAPELRCGAQFGALRQAAREWLEERASGLGGAPEYWVGLFNQSF